MKIVRLLSSVVVLFILLAFTGAIAQNAPIVNVGVSQSLSVSTNPVAGNTAINPVPRDDKWVKRHEEFLEETKKGGIDLLFLGDSITDFWRTKGSNVWNKCYAPRRAANFGIAGDRAQHVLWRIEHGELDGLKPRVIVLMIGTNNTGKERNSDRIRNTTPEVIEGVIAIIKQLRSKLPDSKILFLAIFPRGALDDPQRAQVALINTVLAKLDDGKTVKFLDIGSKFLEPDGRLSKDIMPDLLHPNEKGYQIWADAMEPTLAEMLK
ncbi:MAG: platelet-activating factor acetylhydrolase IB subunit [Verrucomicrobiia bacterium]